MTRLFNSSQMTIHVDKVVPLFLEAEKIQQSSIWNQSVTINPAEKIQVIAPSGSGKTSFIHFIYGMRSDYTGNILFNNRNLKSSSADDLSNIRRKNISIIFQDLKLFAGHTVFQNIDIKRKLNPYHNNEVITKMAARLGIETKLNKLAGVCSYGEQQRTAIIRALQQPFELLLMDEPFSHLDENNRKKAMELIEEEALKRNASILLADLKKTEYFNANQILHL